MTFSVRKNANTVECNESKYEEKPVHLIKLYFRKYSNTITN